MVSKNGFTLLEILIAVLILAIISTLTAVNISKSLKFKKKIEVQIDDYAGLRDALNIMTHDINTAFHWIDINDEIKKKLIQEAQAAGKPPPNFSGSAQRNSDPPIPTEKLTGFVGGPDSLYFTTLSHSRTTVNAQESDQAKIGYYIKDVRSAGKERNNVKALIRRESTVLDDDVTKGGKETVLLEYVQSLKFRYLGGDNKDWVETWKSSGGALDDRTSNKFPDAVEISLAIARDGRELKLSTLAAIHMTNNDPPYQSGNGPPGAQPFGGQK